MDFNFKPEDLYQDWDDTRDVVVATIRVPMDMQPSDILSELLVFLETVGLLVGGDSFKFCKMGDEVVLVKAVHLLDINTTMN
jgi:hypothetical protein